MSLDYCYSSFLSRPISELPLLPALAFQLDCPPSPSLIHPPIYPPPSPQAMQQGGVERVNQLQAALAEAQQQVEAEKQRSDVFRDQVSWKTSHAPCDSPFF